MAGLKRLRNLIVVLAPYAVTVLVTFAIADRLDPATRVGLIAWSVAPGALLAPTFVGTVGGLRADMAGALVLGTVLVSFVLVATRMDETTAALAAAQAFFVAALVAGAVPRVRDRVLVPLRWAGYAAAVGILVFAAANAPPIDATAIALAVGADALALVVAGAVGAALRRDTLAALAAVGTRDPIVGIALAWWIGGSTATAVPLLNAVILGIAARALIMRRR